MSDTLTNDDIAQMIEDAHAKSYILKGVKRTTVATDALTLVLTELLAARAEIATLREALSPFASQAVATIVKLRAERDAAVAEAVRSERERSAGVACSVKNDYTGRAGIMYSTAAVVAKTIEDAIRRGE